MAALSCACQQCKPANERAKPANSGPSAPSHAVETSEMLRILAKAADCSGSRIPRLVWCDVVDRWDSGVAGELASHAALLGLRVRIGEGADNESAVRHGVRLAAMSIRSDNAGTSISISQLVPESAEERAQLGDLLEPLQATLSGAPSPIRVGAHLVRFLTVEATASHRATRVDSSWHADGNLPADIRRIGEIWAVIERRSDKPSSFYVSVMTDRIAIATDGGT
jgi:hypothetical protein